jgi:hypothetical protein
VSATCYLVSVLLLHLLLLQLLHVPRCLCMFQLNCDHDAAECQCYARPGAAAQSLDELEFVRSACHAAQLGQLDKLERILRNRPEAINWDGGTGEHILFAAAAAAATWC